MRFMAMASVSCASLEMEPKDIAPVANRFTISLAGSTSSSGTGAALEFNKPRSVHSCRFCSSIRSVYSLKVSKLFCRTACCSLLTVSDSPDDTRRRTR